MTQLGARFVLQIFFQLLVRFVAEHPGRRPAARCCQTWRDGGAARSWWARGEGVSSITAAPVDFSNDSFIGHTCLSVQHFLLNLRAVGRRARPLLVRVSHPILCSSTTPSIARPPSPSSPPYIFPSANSSVWSACSCNSSVTFLAAARSVSAALISRFASAGCAACGARQRRPVTAVARHGTLKRRWFIALLDHHSWPRACIGRAARLTGNIGKWVVCRRPRSRCSRHESFATSMVHYFFWISSSAAGCAGRAGE